MGGSFKTAKQSICFAAMETSEMRKQFAGYLASKLQHDQTNMPGEKKRKKRSGSFHVVNIHSLFLVSLLTAELAEEFTILIFPSGL